MFRAISGKMEDHRQLDWVGVTSPMSDVAEDGLNGAEKWMGREESGREKGKEKIKKEEKDRRKKEEREKSVRVFGFSKPEYISFSNFQNKISFLCKLVRVFDILKLRN